MKKMIMSLLLSVALLSGTHLMAKDCLNCKTPEAGPLGPTGPTGPAGPGATGPTGLIGPTGLQGNNSAPGASGSTGPIGIEISDAYGNFTLNISRTIVKDGFIGFNNAFAKLNTQLTPFPRMENVPQIDGVTVNVAGVYLAYFSVSIDTILSTPYQNEAFTCALSVNGIVDDNSRTSAAVVNPSIIPPGGTSIVTISNSSLLLLNPGDIIAIKNDSGIAINIYADGTGVIDSSQAATLTLVKIGDRT